MLYDHTAKGELVSVLGKLMQLPSLKEFRLVGGTALSLLMGHRLSEDIDLFTHMPYGTVDFENIKEEISKQFNYVFDKRDMFPKLKDLKENFGISLQVGSSMETSIKVDVFNWTEPFIDGVTEKEGIRFASTRDIALMKLETISTNGRKKDFWDLSELFEQYKLSDLLKAYQEKYPFNSIDEVKTGLKNFSAAEQLPDPICLKNKSWEGIKMQIRREVAHLSKQQRQGPKL
jgi:hypothetical protein